MISIFQDLQFGLRMLAKNPGFTAVAVITLALGIGGSVAVFSLLDAVLLRPLPYSHPEHLFMFFPFEKNPQDAMVATSSPDFQDWQKQSRAFESMAGYKEDSVIRSVTNILGLPSLEPNIYGAFVTNHAQLLMTLRII